MHVNDIECQITVLLYDHLFNLGFSKVANLLMQDFYWGRPGELIRIKRKIHEGILNNGVVHIADGVFHISVDELKECFLFLIKLAEENKVVLR